MPQPGDAFRFDNDVIVQQQDVVAAVFHGLVHAAGKAARSAKVVLVDDPELAAERTLDLGETVGFRHLLRCLGRRR